MNEADDTTETMKLDLIFANFIIGILVFGASSNLVNIFVFLQKDMLKSPKINW